MNCWKAYRVNQQPSLWSIYRKVQRLSVRSRAVACPKRQTLGIAIRKEMIALGKNPRSPLISYACRGKCTSNNVNTAYGYKWSYAE